MLYQLEASKLLITQDPNNGQQIIENATERLRNTILLLRNTVRNIAAKNYTNFRVSLTELIKEFERSLCKPITLEIVGLPSAIPPEIETVLYNNTRESLTNIAKHSNATEVKIALTCTSNNIILIISDNGVLTQPFIVGYGMKAMENRTKLVDGTMITDTTSGFIIKFTIPLIGAK